MLFLSFAVVFCPRFLRLSSVQVKSKSAQSPITKKTERPTKDVPAHKPKNNNRYTWETSRANRGSICPTWRSDIYVGASRALLYMQIRLDPHVEQGKGENNRQIKDEDLLCVGASRVEERGKQPID